MGSSCIWGGSKGRQDTLRDRHTVPGTSGRTPLEFFISPMICDSVFFLKIFLFSAQKRDG